MILCDHLKMGWLHIYSCDALIYLRMNFSKWDDHPKMSLSIILKLISLINAYDSNWLERQGIFLENR